MHIKKSQHTAIATMMAKSRQAATLLWAFSSFIAVQSFQPNHNVVSAPVRRKAFGGRMEIAGIAASRTTVGKGDETVPSLPTVTPLPPVIQQIADNRAEFQINLGRSMDTLRRDMPEILSRKPGSCFVLWS